MTNKPIKTFRLRGVSAAIFANPVKANGGEFTMHKVTLQRTYKEGETFKHVNNFGRDELPVARLLLERAYEFILETESAARSNAKDSEGE